jgi:hypothetical protein
MGRVSKLYNWIFDHIHWGIFCVFIALQFYIHTFVVLFGDDYYYAMFLKSGTNYFISENIFHYMNTNGRSFVHLLDELLLVMGPLLWRYWNVAVIAGIVILIAKISAKEYSGANKKHFSKALVMACVLFSIPQIAILNQSVYWATGTLNYLFPILLLLAFYYFYMKSIFLEKKYLWLPVLAFFTAFTTEQVAFCVLAISAFVLFTSAFIRKKRLKPIQIVIFVSAILGFTILYAAPGNVVRASYYADFYSLSIGGRISYMAPQLFKIIMGQDGMFIYIMLTIVVLAFIPFYRKFTKNKVINISTKALIFLLSASTLVMYMWLLPRNIDELINIPFIILLFSCMTLFLIFGIYDYFKKENQDNVVFIALAIGMQMAFLISPVLGPRMLLISIILLSIPLISYSIKYFGNILFFLISVSIIAYYANYANTNVMRITEIAIILIGIYLLFFMRKFKNPARVTIAIGLIAVAVAFSSLVTISTGYAENYVVHVANDKKIEAYKAEGDFTKTLTLSILKNNKYKHTMPYDDNYEMMRYKILIGLPQTVNITYVP